MLVNGKIGRRDFVGEYFTNMSMLEEALRRRDCISGMHEDYLGNPDSDARTGDVETYGFDYASELKKAARVGIFDTGLIANLCLLTGSMESTGIAYRNRYDVTGDEIDVDAFFSREPEFMYSRVGVRRPEPRLNILVEMGVSWRYTGEQILKGSAAIIRLMKGLEMRRTRVELMGTSGAVTDDFACALIVKVKGADEVLNYPRLLVMANPMFQRGLVWSWESRSTRYMSGYGHPIVSMDREFRRECYEKLLPRMGKVVMLTMREIIDEMDENCEMEPFELDKHMDEWLIGKVNSQL